MVFLALHGGAGENGTIQALLELAGKPYTGLGRARERARHEQGDVEDGVRARGHPDAALAAARRGGDASHRVDVEALGGFPIVVKPNEQGSTVGLTIVTRAEDLAGAIELAFEYGPRPWSSSTSRAAS